MLTIDMTLAYVRDLADREAHALGFLPDTIYGPALSRGRLHLVYENGEPCGFILHGPSFQKLRIYQTAVEPSCRLIDHGREAWLEVLSDALNDDVEKITWICADDLPANKFWERVSSPPIKLAARKGPTRRPLFHYEHILPRGLELEQYLDEQLHRSALWRVCKLQGLEDYITKQFSRRFRINRPAKYEETTG